VNGLLSIFSNEISSFRNRGSRCPACLWHLWTVLSLTGDSTTCEHVPLARFGEWCDADMFRMDACSLKKKASRENVSMQVENQAEMRGI
jgi:hypothetical protein